MILGYFVIAFGAFLLLKNLGIINLSVGFWYLFYPLVFILIGFCLVLGIHNMKKYWKVILGFFIGEQNDKTR